MKPVALVERAIRNSMAPRTVWGCHSSAWTISSNPARSTGPALFVGGWALAQLWLFWAAPLIGGAAGGLLYHWLSPEPSAEVTGVPLKR